MLNAQNVDTVRKAVSQAWNPPSPGAAELIRRTTATLLSEPGALFDEVDEAVLASQPGWAVADRRMAEAVRASNRANLAHWAVANLQNPGGKVDANLGPETTEIAREVVRHGFDDTSLEAYRVGQNVAWRHWMRVAFELSQDPDELAEMLDVSARSIFTFVDETLSGIHEAMDREREQLISRTHTERLEVVNLVLENAPITSQRASERLRYELARTHTAAIVWSDELGASDPGELHLVAETLARLMHSEDPLMVVPSATTVWSWFATKQSPNLDAVRAELTPSGEMRIAIGTTERGIQGFRRSHLRALATQRLLRQGQAQQRFAAYTDVQLVALAAQDPERARAFVRATLGDLAGTEQVLRETLRAYVREQCSASRTARAVYAHRNTVLNRIARAESLLPLPLRTHSLEIGLALEIDHWLGSQRPSRSPAISSDAAQGHSVISFNRP